MLPGDSSAASAGSPAHDPVVWALGALALAWLATQFTLTATLPLLADDHVHLAAARQWTSLHDVLAAAPPRPLQHALFVVGRAAGDDAPAVMRALVVLLHGAAVVMVAVLARGFGASPRRAVAAAALFAAFPAAATIGWPAAVNAPGRLVSTLVVLWAFQRPTPARSLVAVLAAATALTFHQSAVALPALVALQRWALAGGRAADVRGTVVQLARTPAFWLLVGIVAAAALWFRSVPDQHHAARSWQSLAANGVWFTTGLLPQVVRTTLLDGLRGHAGVGGQVAAGTVLVAGLMLAALWFVRGGRVVRFALAAAACDVVLPVLTAGWTLRHMLPAAAFVAIALVHGTSSRARVAVVTGIAAVWLADGITGLARVRTAAQLSGRLVAQAAAVRNVLPPDRELYVVDVPFAAGPEHDVPIGNWGFADAIAATGAAGPVVQLYTAPQPASTAGRVVTAVAVERLQAHATVLRFHAGTNTFELHVDGRRQEPR